MKEVKKMLKFKSRVDKIFFPRSGVIKNDEWGIVGFQTDPDILEVIEGDIKLNSFGSLSVVGNFPSLDYFKTYTVVAKEGKNHKNEFQYELLFIFEEYNFEDESSKRKFLERILTESQVNTLYDYFNDPFELIKNKDMEELVKVKGIGYSTAQKMFSKYDKAIDYSYAYVSLDELGLSTNMIKKLTDSYGSPNTLVEKIKENPYIISDDVDGIGWKKADAIAQKRGIEENSAFRVEAYVKHYLKENSVKGNSYVDPAQFAEDVCKELSIERPLLVSVIREMFDKDVLYWTEDKTFIALKSMYNLEDIVANQVCRILNQENVFDYSGYEKTLAEIEIKQGWEFTNEQRAGVKVILDNNFIVLTGLSGSGKSSLLSAVTTILKEKDYTFRMCALAGKASARMEEITGFKAETIHRMLGYNPKINDFVYNEYNPLDEDVIIMDEVSMVGGELFYQAIRAVKNGAKLILVGDDGQLESIGTLNVFYDLLNSPFIPKVRLTEIHRQAQNSAIVTESIKIRKGEQILERGFVGTEVRGVLQDLIIHAFDEKEMVAMRILEVYKEEHARLRDIKKLQVIVPMRENGDSSVYNLNILLQDYVNPTEINGQFIEIGGGKKKPYKIKVGDKVVNKKNNYKTINIDSDLTPVYNGNFGIVKEIDTLDETMIIDFDLQGRVYIPKSHWNYIELGYASTVHSQQGSQVEVAIVGLDFSSYIMLVRELPYTAITRAQKKCHLVVQTSALSYAIGNSQVPNKKTFLQDLLKERLTNG